MWTLTRIHLGVCSRQPARLAPCGAADAVPTKVSACGRSATVTTRARGSADRQRTCAAARSGWNLVSVDRPDRGKSALPINWRLAEWRVCPHIPEVPDAARAARPFPRGNGHLGGSKRSRLGANDAQTVTVPKSEAGPVPVVENFPKYEANQRRKGLVVDLESPILPAE